MARESVFAQERINNLTRIIEYLKECARLRSVEHCDIEKYKNELQSSSIFVYEHELLGLPGVRYGNNAGWLSFDALKRTQPPQVVESLLLPWVDMTSGPDKKPSLRSAVPSEQLDGICAVALSGDVHNKKLLA